MKVNETLLHREILTNAGAVLKGLKVAHSEYPLYRAYDLLSYDVVEALSMGTGKPKHYIGRIDLILDYKGKRYITEIKYAEPSNSAPDFWQSLKVLGYTAYYKWQTKETRVHPAIIIPFNSVKLEQQIICGALNLSVFAAFIEGGKMKLKLLDNTPIWKQKASSVEEAPDEYRLTEELI